MIIKRRTCPCGARARLNVIIQAREMVKRWLLSERGIDAIDLQAARSVGHAVVEARTSTLEAGIAALSCLLLDRLSLGLLSLLCLGTGTGTGAGDGNGNGTGTRLLNRDLVLDSSLHGLLTRSLRVVGHCEGTEC